MEANSHVPVLLTETVSALGLSGAKTVVDGTFGRGGHSSAILAQLGPEARLIAIDRDPDAVRAAERIADTRFSISHAKFSEIDRVLAEKQVSHVDAVLLDIGVSSPQFDNPARGFGFRADAALDMRMDPGEGDPASVWLNQAEAVEIQRILRIYGEERFAKQIAAAIVARRKYAPVSTTRQLAELVEKVVHTRGHGKNPATRTFQAIRIFINRELEELQIVLPKAFEALRPGGRLAVITFHSLEDRIVKRFMRSMTTPAYVPERLPLRADQLPKACARWIVRRAIPGADELACNPRARSAALRVIEKLAP